MMRSLARIGRGLCGFGCLGTLALFLAFFLLGGAFGVVGGTADFTLEIIAGSLKFTHAFAYSAGEFGQFLGSKEQEDDDEDDNHLRALEAHDAGDKCVVHDWEKVKVLAGNYAPDAPGAKETFPGSA